MGEGLSISISKDVIVSGDLRFLLWQWKAQQLKIKYSNVDKNINSKSTMKTGSFLLTAN